MVEKKLYAIVETLADEFGFDADEAMEVVGEQAEELYALFASLTSKPKKGGEAKEEIKGGGAVEEDEAVKKTRHNIELWEKKLEKGDFKDKAAHEAKIEKEKAKLEGHTDWVKSVAISTDGKTIVSGSDDQTVR